jgi:hypothetical protein
LTRGRLAALLVLLAILCGAAYGLHARRWLYVIGGVGTLAGWRFGFVLALFVLTAAATAALPRARFGLLTAASLLQLFVLNLDAPLKPLGALVLWTGFYLVVHLEVSWWLKGPAIATLHAAPLVLTALDPGSALLGILLATHFTSNFALRSALYAYEAARKRELLRGAGFPGFLLYLIAAPIGAVKLAPIGFAVLHRGLRAEADLGLMSRGVSQTALGFLYLTLRHMAVRTGCLPIYDDVVAGADLLDAATAFAACHLLLLGMFLDVAGHVHVAVGMMRVLGFDIPSGTEAPYLSRNILDFWRRWNTYYRDYLLTLAYYPAAWALKRRPLLAVAAGGAATFVLSGLAHAVQSAVRRPDRATLQGFAEGHVWALVYGLVVVGWMLQERLRAGAGRAAARPAAAGGAPPPSARPWQGIRRAAAAAGTLSVASVLLLLLYPPIRGFPVSTALSIMAAFLRPPWA